MPKSKGSTIPLNAFLADGANGSVAPEAKTDKLPEAPSSRGNESGERKVWMAHLDGTDIVEEELKPPDLSAGVKAAQNVDEFKAAIDLALREFLSGGDTLEVVRCVLELNAPQFHYQVVKRGVTLAMDRAGREREMIAVLFSSLHVRGVLTSEQILAGFRALLESVEDLRIDIPDAPALLSHYLADSYLDGMIPLAQLEGLTSAFAAAAAPSEVLRQAHDRMLGRVPTGGSQIDPGTMRAKLRVVVEEYLQSKDVTEVSRRLSELCVPHDMQHELVRAAVELGLERKDHDREMVSQLLSSLHERWFPAAHLARGFEQLLARIDDLAIDNPKAPDQLAAFMTRAIADELLPPAFVTTAPPMLLATPTQLAVLTTARAPLAASHFGQLRRHVWGAAAGGNLDALKKEVQELVSEFLVSGEIDEAVRCVRELEAPSYLHEVVKKLVSSAIVDGGERERGLALALTEKLANGDALLSAELLAQGCMRLVEAADDLRLDHPKAPVLLADYLDQCCKLSLLKPADEWTVHAESLRGNKA